MAAIAPDIEERIQQLADAADRDSVRSLFQILFESADGVVRARVAEALAGVRGLDSVPPLLQALAHERKELRKAAAEALGRLGDDRAVEKLIEATKDSEPSVRVKAVESLGKIGDPRATDRLLEFLSGMNAGLKILAAEALGRVGDPRAVDPLLRCMADAGTEIRRAEMPQQDRSAAARNAAAGARKGAEEAWILQWTVATALGRIGDARGVNAFIAWSHRIYSSELRHMSAEEKIRLVRDVADDFFRKLPPADLQTLPHRIQSMTRIKSWQALSTVTDMRDWLEVMRENPLWTSVQAELARRNDGRVATDGGAGRLSAILGARRALDEALDPAPPAAAIADPVDAASDPADAASASGLPESAENGEVPELPVAPPIPEPESLAAVAAPAPEPAPEPAPPPPPPTPAPEPPAAPEFTPGSQPTPAGFVPPAGLFPSSVRFAPKPRPATPAGGIIASLGLGSRTPPGGIPRPTLVAPAGAAPGGATPAPAPPPAPSVSSAPATPVPSSTSTPPETVAPAPAAPRAMPTSAPPAEKKAEPPAHAVHAFAALLKLHGANTMVVIGSAVHSLLRHVEPDEIRVAPLLDVSDDELARLSDPEAWNDGFAPYVSGPISRLAEALSVTPARLLLEGATFEHGGRAIPVRYVGPYRHEEDFVRRDARRVERGRRRVHSRLGLVADRASARLVGMRASFMLDRIWLDVEGRWGGRRREAMADLAESRLSLDWAPERPGMLDLLHFLRRKHSLRAAPDRTALDLVNRAAKFARENPDLARAEFDGREFSGVAELAGIDRALLELEAMGVDAIVAEELESHVRARRRARLAERASGTGVAVSQVEIDALVTEAEARKLAYAELGARFGELADQLDGAKAARAALEERLRGLVRDLTAANDADRDVSARVERATAAFRQMTAEGRADLAVIQEHREASSARRETEEAVAARRKEVESLRAEIETAAGAATRLQLEMERLGLDMEEALHALVQARQKADAARAGASASGASGALDPDRAREILLGFETV